MPFSTWQAKDDSRCMILRAPQLSPRYEEDACRDSCNDLKRWQSLQLAMRTAANSLECRVYKQVVAGVKGF